MANYKKYNNTAKTTKSERRKKPPHLQPSYNAEWWKEFNSDDKKEKKVDYSKVRTLNAEKYPQPTLKKKKNEKRHNKIVQHRLKEIEEKGFYFIDHDKSCAGKLYRWNPLSLSVTTQVWDYKRGRWATGSKEVFHYFNKDLLNFSKDEQGIPPAIWLNQTIVAEQQGKVVKPETLLKEAMFCTGKVVKMRNDSAFPSTIALEVYSVELGFVFISEDQLKRY